MDGMVFTLATKCKNTVQVTLIAGLEYGLGMGGIGYASMDT